MKKLENKVALITGASSGFGKATAKLFAQEGANLVLVDLKKDPLKQVAAACQSLGAQVEIVAGDAGSEKIAEQAVELATKKFGKLDILDNNVGLGRIETIVDTPMSDFDLVMRTNTRSAYAFSKYAAKQMIRQQSGQIIFLSSITGTIGQAGESAYTMSKFAVRGLAQALDQELLGQGIKVTALEPHAASTNFEVGHGRGKANAKDTGFLSADDIAQAMLYIATQPANAHIVELKIASNNMKWPLMYRQPIPDDYKGEKADLKL